MSTIREFLRPKEFTGKHMLAIMLSFFGVIITVNFFMAWQANSTWTGLVVKNSYVASQEFNEVTAAKEAQLALGWDASISNANGGFEIVLTDREGKAVHNVEAVADIGRPAHENEDQTLTLREASNGRFVADTELAPGLWQADITVSNQTGVIWTRSLRFTVGG